ARPVDTRGTLQHADARAAAVVEPEDEVAASGPGRVADGDECAGLPAASVLERRIRREPPEGLAVEDADLREPAARGCGHDLGLTVPGDVADRDAHALPVCRIGLKTNIDRPPRGNAPRLRSVGSPAANVRPSGIRAGDDRRGRGERCRNCTEN